MAQPHRSLTFAVDVDVAHLANPLLAVSRLLMSEADAFVHVHGDESHFDISVALTGDDDDSLAHAEQWVRWARHNAGVRGRVSVRAPRQPRPRE
jgi:hypothetical protein